MPDAIMALTHLSACEQKVLSQICFRAATNDGVCYDTNPEIAAAVHIHEITVSKAIKTLHKSDLMLVSLGNPRMIEPRSRLVALFAKTRDNNSALTPSSTSVTATSFVPVASSMRLADGLPLANGLGLADDLGRVSHRLRKGKPMAKERLADDLPLYIGIEKYKREKSLFKKNGCGKKPQNQPLTDSSDVPAPTGAPPQSPPVAAAPPVPQKPAFVPPPASATARPAPATRPKAAPNGQLGLPLAPPPRPGDPFLRQSQAETCNVPFSAWFRLYGNNTGEVSCKGLWIELTDEERLKAMEHTPLYLAAQSMHKLPYNYLFDKHFNSKIINRHAANAETRPDQNGGRGAVLPLKQYTKQTFRRNPASGNDAV